jgi:hypothetical protein
VKAAMEIDKIPFNLKETVIVISTLPETKIGWGLQLVDNAYMWSLLYYYMSIDFFSAGHAL